MRRLAVILLAAAAAGRADMNEDLIAAARKGDLPAVKTLIEHGAPIEAKTPYGQTPLYVAAIGGREDVVAYLLDKGAKTDVTDTFYKAPMLDFVLERKHYTVAKMLIAKGDVKVDHELKDVADTGQTDLVEALLAKGPPSQKTLDTVYEAALEDKKADIAGLLKKAGAHEPAPPFAVDSKVLDSYAGTYKTEKLPFDLKVYVQDGRLYCQAGGQSAFATKAKSATVFVYPQYNLEIEFDSPGSFTLKQGGQTFAFKKVVAQ